MNTDRPLDGLGSIKVKLGVLVVASVVAATVVSQVGSRADVPAWLTFPVTIAGSLLVAQWLARGMTSPLREMTAASARMATGDHSQRVTATSSDEVGILARAFNTMAADLAASDHQRRQLIATVSHELRTPLTAQQALLENLVDGVGAPETALRAALSQAERLSALVSDLLDLSRVDGGLARLDITAIDLPALVAQAVGEVEAANTREVVVTTEVPDIPVHADPGRLAQVLANLLDNAVRHSPAGAAVTVRCATLPEDRWYLEVTDQGEGIAPADREQVFRRFGTADAAGGTGLGLAIVQSICELHGGTVSVLPAEAGARLRAVLPLRPQPPSPVLPEEPAMTTTPAETETPASTATPPSVVPSLFGRWWPERGLQPRPALLLGSIAIGVLAAMLLPHRQLGLGLLLVSLAAGGFVLRHSVNLRSRWSQVYAGLGVALSLLIVLRAAEWINAIALAVGGVLLTTALTNASQLPGIVGGWLSWVLAGVRGLPLLGRTLETMSKRRTLWPILRTAAISLVALVIFGGLFASGDAIFGSWVSALLPDLEVDSFVERAFVAFAVGGVVLAASYVAINPPAVDALGLPQPRRVTHAWEWLVPVGLVIVVFAGFVVAQATAMWGGHDYVRRTTGLSYADYVHQGFGQLTFATFLTLLTVALAARKAPQATERDRMVLRGMLATLCLLALVVVASALYRMSVYQDAYGYTVLRVLVDAFELWMGLLLVLVLVAGIRLDGRWIPRVALLTGASLVLVLGLANPEGWVAEQNIERYEQTGKLDLGYLSGLGPDATPAIVDGLPADLARCVLVSDDVPRAGEGIDGVLEWNLGRSRARASLGEDLSGLPQNCPATLP